MLLKFLANNSAMTTNSSVEQNQESSDAEVVNEAMERIQNGKIDQAESLLLGVIANTPATYENTFETTEAKVIKFWSQAEFLHYITWAKQHGSLDREVQWHLNAYPRAHFYMGLICVGRKQYDRALEYLRG